MGIFVFPVVERHLRLKLSDPNEASPDMTWKESVPHIFRITTFVPCLMCNSDTYFPRSGLGLLALSHFATRQVGTQLSGLVAHRAMNKDSVEAALMKDFKGFKAPVVIVRIERLCDI